MDDPALWVGLLALASLAAGALLVGDPRAARWFGATALLGGAGLIVADNWGTDRLVELRGNEPLLGAAALAAAGTLAALTLVFRRHPLLLPLALVATLAVRVPIDLAGSEAKLLAPLYAVIGAGVLAGLLAPREQAAYRGVAPPSGPLRWIAPLLAAFIALYALQVAYADDLSVALERLCFFFVPFAVLFRLLVESEWSPRLLGGALLVLVAEAIVVALVGFGQYAVGEVFWNQKVISGNEAHVWFRVNSLFFDPNIMGRFLALVMVVLAGVVAYGAASRDARRAAGTFAVLLAALTITYSVSSMLALLAGLVALAALRWGLGWGAIAGAAVAGSLALAVVAIGGGGDLAEETTGRTGLVSGGVELITERPLLGHGSGSFAPEFIERFDPGPGVAAESHTQPITVWVEQGLPGLVPYGLLLLAALGGLLRAVGPRREPSGATPQLATILALLSVLVVHSLGYAAFFTDPFTWALLALGVALAPPPPTPPGQSEGG